MAMDFYCLVIVLIFIVDNVEGICDDSEVVMFFAWQVPADGSYGSCDDYYKSGKQKVRFADCTSALSPTHVICHVDEFFTRKSSYYFQRVLAIAVLSVRHTGASVKMV